MCKVENDFLFENKALAVLAQRDYTLTVLMVHRYDTDSHVLFCTEAHYCIDLLVFQEWEGQSIVYNDT